MSEEVDFDYLIHEVARTASDVTSSFEWGTGRAHSERDAVNAAAELSAAITSLLERAERAEANAEMVKMLREELSQLREASRWISVEERLPDDDVLVLLHSSFTDDFVGSRDRGQWFDAVYQNVPGVSHWRNLPEPPQEEE